MTEEAEQLDPLPGPLLRALGVIDRWLNGITLFAAWMNDVRDQRGVWERIGVMAALFLMAITVTVMGCGVTYGIVELVKWAG